MNAAHPRDRGERRTVKNAKKRRETFIKEALKKQEAEDVKRIESERLQAALGRVSDQFIGGQAEDLGVHHTI